MIKTAITLTLLFLFSFTARSAQWPDSILHRSFAVQSVFLDTTCRKLGNLDSVQLTAELIDLEKWASRKKDPQLRYITRLARYTMFILREHSNAGVEDDLHELISQLEKNKWLETEALETLGLYYWRIKKEYAAALEIYLRAHNLYFKFSLDEFPHKPEFQWHLGVCYYRFRDYNLAKQYFQEVFANTPFDKIDNPVSKINTIALCFRKIEMYDSSLHYFEYAMDIAKKRNAEDWIGILNGNIADNLFRLGRLEEPIPMFLKDLEIGLKAKDTPSAALTLSSLGDIYRLKNERQKALEATNRSLEMAKLSRLDPFVSNHIYSSAAKTYEYAGNMTMAYQLLDSAFNALQADHKQSDLILLSGVQHKVDEQTHMADLRAKQNQLDRQRLLRNSFIAGFALVLFFTIVAYRQKKRLSQEKKRSDRLLLNILPAETAEELKQTGKAAARSFENVTILFTDFKDFTKVSEKMSAEELVEVINYYYSQFDMIMTKHNVEKIKTIGDSYMCAGGLPIPSETHAHDVVAAAIEIMQFNEKERKQGKDDKVKLELRVGIHTGPAIAGIVGINKFAYDIWGDAVNVAKRMESSGEAGRINISETTYTRIKNQFPCSFRGEIDAKNKGMMNMYFVEWE
jgi:class 3 adenylate cyclase